MRYRNTKRKLRKIWLGTNDNFQRIESEWVKDRIIEKAIQDGRFHLFKRMNGIQTEFEQITIDEGAVFGYKTWEVQIRYIPRRFLPFIKFAVILDKHFNPNLTQRKQVNHIVRIDEEDIGGEDIVRVTFLIGMNFIFLINDPLPQIDTKLIMYIYNPEFYV